MSKLKGKIVRAFRVRDTKLGRLVGQSLRELRELAGLTQAEVAEHLKLGRTTVSKIEHCGDIQISLLHKYVGALGAKLRIEAAFSRHAIRSLRLASVFDHEFQDEDQFVLPIIGDDLFRQARDVVLSVHPHYSHKIFEGHNTLELRRRFPGAVPRGTTAFIYSTSPVRAMVGSAEIKDVMKLPVDHIWAKYSKMAQINRLSFEEYFSGLTEGFALRIANARLFVRPIDLSELRERFGFEPPQSFLYVTPTLRTALKDEYPHIPY